MFSPLYTKKIALYSIGGIFVQEFIVRFRSLRDIQEFVGLCSRQSFPVQVGGERYRVNATSFMGMFSLNCKKPLKVMVDCTEEEFQGFLRQVQRFLDT